MKHIVNYSGGLCSFWAAHRVVKKHGAKDVVLLFADTLIEDPELYIFNEQASNLLGVPITRISLEMTPWELFQKEGMIGNSKAPFCSVRLKRAILDEWHREHALEMDSIIYVGFDWTEHHRLDALRIAKPTWRFEAPMTEPPYWDKCTMQTEAEKLGLVIPILYRLGFPHNNCGGRCVKAGISHWVHLLKTLPERFMEWEIEEAKTNAILKERGALSDFSILKDRRNGVVRPLTLRELRLRVAVGEQFSRFDWGGCGCGGVT